MKYKGDNISIIGSSHIKNNTICQDSSGYYYDEKYCIAIACDGHGGEKYFRSDKGSLLATEVGIDAINNFLIYEKHFSKDRNKLLVQLEKNIILNWNKAVNEHLNKNPFTENELDNLSEKDKNSVLSNIETAYGTTLIAILISNDYSFCIQIGDGDCVILKSDGTIELPIPDDDRLQFNITTSLSDKKAIMNFRHIWLENPPVAAIVNTDGVRNSFVSEEFFIQFCKDIFESYNDTEIEVANLELKEFLPRLSERGSGDDVSISIIFDIEKLETVIKGLNNKTSKQEVYENGTEECLDKEYNQPEIKDEDSLISLILEEENEQDNENNTR